MNENNENNNIDVENKNFCKDDKICNLIKFAVLLITLFLACYLAVYYIMDQIRHSYYLPAVPIENIDRIIKEQDRMFEKDLGTFPMYNKALKQMKTPVEIFKDGKENIYKIIIDLKEFNNDTKNIKLDIEDDRVSITGISEKNNKSQERLYTYTQSFDLPETIDTKSVTKEKTGNKYIITLPIENPLDETDVD